MRQHTNPRTDNLGFEFDEPYMNSYNLQHEGKGCLTATVIVSLGFLIAIIYLFTS